MSTLFERLSQPDLMSLPDWEAAEVLNAPDPSAPVIDVWEPTQIGAGQIMQALGAIPGAAVLSAIEGEAVTNPVMKWGLEILRAGSFDLSSPVARETVRWLVQMGLLTSEQCESIFALSRRERRPSWAERNGIEVTARTVGLARGGI